MFCFASPAQPCGRRTSRRPRDVLCAANSPPPPPRARKDRTSSSKRNRSRLTYTDDHPTPSTVTLQTIGVVHSPYLERFGTPRQPSVTENTLGNAAQPASVELYDGHRFELALRGLRDFEYCWVISFFHLNQGWNPLVRPPRGPKEKQGLFATRSPHRPNSVGLSCMRITGVDCAARTIHFLGCDLLDGTAVLDIKVRMPSGTQRAARDSAMF
jgi:tRNA (adenine37-N6)-methyltransferase